MMREKQRDPDPCALCGSRPEWSNAATAYYCPGRVEGGAQLCDLGGRAYSLKHWNALHKAIREGGAHGYHWERCPKCDGSGKGTLDRCRCGTGYGSRMLAHPDECVCEVPACGRCGGRGSIEYEREESSR